MTALHRAVIDGHADIVNVLLQAGCSVDKKDEVNQIETFPLGYEGGGGGFVWGCNVIDGHAEMAHVLFEAGHSADGKDGVNHVTVPPLRY